jgi:DNA-binding transcriptional MocR family regulator
LFDLLQIIPRRASAATIASTVETAISDGSLGTGTALPTVRELAAALEVSPATVASAYRLLRQRGLTTANRRLGTTVAAQPPLPVRPPQPLPAGTRDLARGNPDPRLLPPLAPALARLGTEHKLYGGPSKLARLVELAEADFAADRIAGPIAVVGGALDAIERVLQTQLLPGDRVALEDPTWPRIADLVQALGFVVEPVAVDTHGLVPTALEQALDAGARAVIITPRGQNPTGAALGAARGAELRTVIERRPETLVIEDDYVAAVAGAPYVPVHGTSTRWAVVRSVSKVLGPDLRIALMAGDARTVARVEGRQLLGSGWVSHLLQQTAADLWGRASTRKLLARAARVYGERRAALVEALADHGIEAFGDSGLGVWVPVPEEVVVVQHLLEHGFAVSAGERYRFGAPPGIRVTTTTLEPREARRLAALLAEAVDGRASTYDG